MKINIGCGSDIRKGYINIDRNPAFGPDLLCDAVSLPFADNSASEILASDILEHFPWRNVEDVLREWRRVLSPTGVIEIRTPDLQGMFRLYSERPEGWRRGDARDGSVDPIVERLYGGQDHEGNYHYVIFDRSSISELLERAGFFVGTIEHDGPDISNMVVRAYKKLSGEELVSGRSDCLEHESCPVYTRFMEKIQQMVVVHEDPIQVCSDDVRFYLISGINEDEAGIICERMKQNMSGLKGMRITWEAPTFGPSGYAYAARNYMTGLDEAGVRICTKPVWGDCEPELVSENDRE